MPKMQLAVYSQQIAFENIKSA